MEEKSRVSGDRLRRDAEGSSSSILPTTNQESEKAQASKPAAFHPAVYVIVWITLSSSIILFNKWILDKRKFAYPVILTTWHLLFASVMTQILARTTTLLDARRTVKMTGRLYLRAILPIGTFFSLSLVCGNLTYIYLSVSFAQMLKATTPVAVLLAGWGMGVQQPNIKVLINVSIIVLGIVLATVGEIDFVLIGFLFQLGGIVSESVKLVLIESLLNGAEHRMDPLVSLYYLAPACTLMNGIFALIWEVPYVTMAEVSAVGLPILFTNAFVAFALNVSVVFLIGRTSSLILTLCGVLKDILLVAFTMIVWGTEVSPLQFFGYSIALAGLIYYKLGADQLKSQIHSMSRGWSEYGVRQPVTRKLIMLFGVILALLFLLGGLAARYAPDYDPVAAWAANKDKWLIGGFRT